MLNKNVTNTAECICLTCQDQERLKTQRQVTAVIFNRANLLKTDIISVNISKIKNDVFIAIVLECPL